MRALLEAIVCAFFAAFRVRASLVAENLVLRRQLAILRRATPRPRLRPMDRAFWVVVSRLWSRWADSLAFTGDRDWLASAWFRPLLGTEVAAGRAATLAPELVRLIERMAQENPLAGSTPS